MLDLWRMRRAEMIGEGDGITYLGRADWKGRMEAEE